LLTETNFFTGKCQVKLLTKQLRWTVEKMWSCREVKRRGFHKRKKWLKWLLLSPELQI